MTKALTREKSILITSYQRLGTVRTSKRRSIGCGKVRVANTDGKVGRPKSIWDAGHLSRKSEESIARMETYAKRDAVQCHALKYKVTVDGATIKDTNDLRIATQSAKFNKGILLTKQTDGSYV